MNEYYVKCKDIIERDEKDYDNELIQSLLKCRKDLDIANKNYEYAEGDLIDYYTYQIKANQAKIDYLIKKIKKKGLMLDIVNETKFRLQSKNEVI